MAKQVAKTNDKTPPELTRRGLSLTDWRLLDEMIWPNTSKEAKLMAVDYCRAKNLDPILRPFNIVGIPTKQPDGKWKTRESVWWAIQGLRIIAHRTGEYVGQSEPTYGPTIEATIGKAQVVFPEWCKVTVKRMVAGKIAEFSAVRYWRETYQRVSSKEDTPNKMWQRRCFEQLGKCTEADALRKGFPEGASGVYISDELPASRIDPDGALKGDYEERPLPEEPAPEAPQKATKAKPKKKATAQPEKAAPPPEPEPAAEEPEPEKEEAPMVEVKDHIGALAARYDGSNLTECNSVLYDLLSDCGEEDHVFALKTKNQDFLEAMALADIEAWKEFLQKCSDRCVEIQGEIASTL